MTSRPTCAKKCGSVVTREILTKFAVGIQRAGDSQVFGETEFLMIMISVVNRFTRSRFTVAGRRAMPVAERNFRLHVTGNLNGDRT